MNRGKIFVLAALALVGALFGAAHTQTLATRELPASLKNASTEARWHTDYDFTSDIDRARELLEKENAGFETAPIVKKVWKRKKLVSEKVVGQKLTDFTVLLAVKHRDRKDIELIRMSKDGENPAGYDIDWKKANGVNTNFVIEHPEGYSILAIKRVIRSGKKNFVEVPYTPFTADIDTPMMRAKGLQYLLSTLTAAGADLKKNNVASNASPGQSVSDVVPLDVSLMLSIIEHIDPARSQKEPIEKLVNEVLVTVGANRKLSYAYAISKAKARGLFQFIPRTYVAINKRYPSAGLTKSFAAGMNDHVNAAKASLLLFDADLAQLASDKRSLLLKDKMKLAEYLAIAYNSGARRAVLSYESGGSSALPKETVLYRDKLRKTTLAFK